MPPITQSAIVVTVTALAPLVAQAEMVELSDAELRAVQGQGPISGLREALQNYRRGLEPLWTELPIVQGLSPPLHYAGWSAVLAGYAISGPAGAALMAIEDALFPVNRLGVVAQPAARVGSSLRLTGVYLLYLYGEYVPAS
ncbi:MAG: hypothetical protein WBC62_00750 [Candidatus Macondimonas sp.]